MAILCLASMRMMKGYSSARSTSPADEVVQLIGDRGGVAVASYESVADHTAADMIIKACEADGGHDPFSNADNVVRHVC